MHIPQSWVMSRTADVHEVQEATDKSNVLRQRKTCWSVQIKTGWMSLNWRLSRQDVHQSRLEGLGGRGHNDSSRQLVPNSNSSRKENVVEGIDTPSWNTKLTTCPHDTGCSLTGTQKSSRWRIWITHWKRHVGTGRTTEKTQNYWD